MRSPAGDNEIIEVIGTRILAVIEGGIGDGGRGGKAVLGSEGGSPTAPAMAGGGVVVLDRAERIFPVADDGVSIGGADIRARVFTHGDGAHDRTIEIAAAGSVGGECGGDDIGEFMRVLSK